MGDTHASALPNQSDTGGIGAILPPDSLRVGFSCTDLLGTLSAAESERLLHAAIESGITYFDTARMYGSGEAEGILGRLVPEHRRRMILVSKAGILPPSRSIAIRTARKAVTLGLQAFPDIRKKLLDIPPFGARVGVFDLPSLRASLDTSLKELRTDYLDVFLLHEIAPAQANAPIVGWLQDMQRIGKIRSFGIASDFSDTVKIMSDVPELARIVQFANSVWEPNILQLSDDPARLVVTDCCLGRRFHELCRSLIAQPDTAKRWSRQLDIDVRDPAALASLFLADSVASNPDGIVLFSSRRPEHIAANAQLGRSPIKNPMQGRLLRELVNELPSGAN